jgi:hypothetical protein
LGTGLNADQQKIAANARAVATGGRAKLRHPWRRVNQRADPTVLRCRPDGQGAPCDRKVSFTGSQHHPDTSANLAVLSPADQQGIRLRLWGDSSSADWQSRRCSPDHCHASTWFAQKAWVACRRLSGEIGR